MNDRNSNLEQFEERIAASEQKAQQWERRYKEATISHALEDAARGQGAFNADQVVTLLRGMTKLVETTDKATGKPTGRFEAVVDFPETDPKTGKPVAVQKTPEEAVRRMNLCGAFHYVASNTSWPCFEGAVLCWTPHNFCPTRFAGTP